MATTTTHSQIVSIWIDALGKGIAPEPFTDSSLLHVPGTSGLSGDYQGAQAIRGVLDQMSRLTGDTLHFRLSRVVATENHAILWGRLIARSRRAELNTPSAHVLEIGDGAVSEAWMFNEDQEAVDRLWTGRRESGSARS